MAMRPVGFGSIGREAGKPGKAEALASDRTPPPTAAIDAVLLPEGALALDQPLPVPAPVEVLSGGFRRQGDTKQFAAMTFKVTAAEKNIAARLAASS